MDETNLKLRRESGYGGSTMKLNEALEIITNAILTGEFTSERDKGLAIIAQQALEKQITKKPIRSGDSMRYSLRYTCPSCGGDFAGTGIIADYCYHCGQALWWGDEPNLVGISATNPDYELVRTAFRVEKSEWLNLLTEREAHILVLRYGLDGNGKRTYEQIGREYQVTRERIRQIEHKAFRKLRVDYWNREG